MTDEISIALITAQLSPEFLNVLGCACEEFAEIELVVRTNERPSPSYWDTSAVIPEASK